MIVRFQMYHGKIDRQKTGKGKFFHRLAASLGDMGVEITCDPKVDVDVDVCINKPLYWPKNAKKKIVRLGPVEYDTNRKDLKEQWALSKKYIKFSDGIVYQSDFSRDTYHKIVYDARGKKPERVIFNGAPPAPAVVPCPEVLGKDRKGPWDYNEYYHRHFLLSTREWVWEKRLEEGIKSFILANLPHSHLWIAGHVWDQPKRFPPKQKTFYKKYGKPNIHFLGPLDDFAIQLLYKHCHAMLFLSWIDACPNSVVEALMAGCPVISNCCGGQFELINLKSLEFGCAQIRSENMWNFKPRNRRVQPKAYREGYARHMNDVARNPQRVPPSCLNHIFIDTVAHKYKTFFEELLK